MTGDRRPGTFKPFTLAPFCVSVDWLCVNMDAPAVHRWEHAPALPWQLVPGQVSRWELEGSEGIVYYVVGTDRRTAQFDSVCEIQDGMAVKMGTILSKPRGDGAMMGRPATWMQFQPSNEALASGDWSTLLTMFRLLGCVYTSISRLDIACDGIEGDGGEFPQVVEAAHKGAGRYFGKAKWTVEYDRRTVIGFAFGTKSSNKYLRAYRKKREMKVRGRFKPHIAKMWEDALGWDAMAAPGVEVNRFEARLVSDTEVVRYFPKAKKCMQFIEDLSSPDHRVDIVASMAVGMFDFRTEHSDRARDAQPMQTWDWSKVHRGTPDIRDRAQRTIALGDYGIKIGLHNWWRIATQIGGREGLETARRYAEACGPEYVEWYDRKQHIWTKALAKLSAAGDDRTKAILLRLKTGGTVRTMEEQLRDMRELDDIAAWGAVNTDTTAWRREILRSMGTDESALRLRMMDEADTDPFGSEIGDAPF